jgi:hypothetical protein
MEFLKTRLHRSRRAPCRDPRDPGQAFKSDLRGGAAVICGLIVAAAGYPAPSYAQLPSPYELQTSDTYVEGFNPATGLGQTVYPAGGVSSAGTANFDFNVATTEGQAIATTSYGSAAAGPSVSATAESYTGSFTAYASLTYYFSVNGPGGSTYLDMSAFANAITNPGTTGFSSEAALSIYAISAPQTPVPGGGIASGEVLVTCVAGSCPSNPGAYVLPTTAEKVQENQLYEVDLLAYANAGTSSSSTENILSAIVDPDIVLDPSDASGLSLVFSQGINEPGYVAPVPLPDGFVLMLCGLGLLGLVVVPRKAA